MAKYIFKRANKNYIPLWMYMVQALLSIADGFINLFILPFGYLCGFTGSWAGYMLRHSFDKQKRLKAERQKRIDEYMDSCNGEQ